MKRKAKTQIIFTVYTLFALLTCYIMVYAFYHRKDSELILLVFGSYAILALLAGIGFLMYWQRVSRRRRKTSQEAMLKLVNSLASPAMLWTSTLDRVVLNEALIGLSELTKHEDGFDARHVVPWFFGEKIMTDTLIEELSRARDRECTFTTKSGKEHTMIWNTAGMDANEDGSVWFLSIGLDLADIRKMQSELSDYSKRLAVSEGRHMLTMELTDIGILLIEQGNPNWFPSDKLRSMFGITTETITLEEVRERVYPLDLMTFDNHVQTMRSHMNDYLNRTGIMEIRIGSADSQYRWYSYRFKAMQRADTGRLVVGGSVIDVSAEKEKDAMIERIAYEDTVTGIPNRNKLMRMGEDLYNCTKELNTSYWVIVMDIDRFHLINDTCGYASGNLLLRGFAEAMMRQLNLGGFGARISGDNFALILRDTGDDALPQKVIAKIQRALATQAVGQFANRALTCSAGYAKMPLDGDSFEHVLERAEFALSSSKKMPGEIYRYTSQMHDTIVAESMLEQELADAVMNHQLILYYQPKVSLKTGAIVGLEALVRWQHPSGRLIMPGEFIGISERSPLVMQITRFVLYEACRQAHFWQQIGLPPILMSVNVSGTDFYQENICQQITQALRRNALQPEYLEIELTESLALRDIDMTIVRMEELRAAGIRIAMDDFGTGYSSLSYIQKLPFTMIKLDRSFVMDMNDDPVMTEIVSSVVRIARAKGISTIAEGVETAETASKLRALGCDQIQGYYCGKPMPARDVEILLRQNMKERFVFD